MNAKEEKIESEEIRRLVTERGLVQAVRELRCRGVAFPEAARIVSEGAQDLPPPEAVATVTPLERSDPLQGDIEPLCKRLAGIADLLHGLNYQITTDARGLSRGDPSLDPARVIATLYPESVPTEFNVRPLPPQVALDHVREVLLYEGDSGSHPDSSGLETVRSTELPGLLDAISACLSADSEAFSYNSDAGLPGYYVYWCFCFLFHDPTSGNWLSISAVASD